MRQDLPATDAPFNRPLLDMCTQAGKAEGTTEAPMTKLLLRALAGETLPTPPIWMMRQAGR
jgi:hypothetical protein